MKRKNIQIIIVIICTLAGLYLALYNVDFSEVGSALQQARWGWVGLGALCMVVSFLLRAYRWNVLLDHKLPVLETFGLINIGYLVSDIFPLRAGDPARAVAASLRSPISTMAALSTVVVERTLDMITIGLIMVITLPFISGVSNAILPGFIGGGAAIAALVVLVLMARYPEKVESIARWFLERLPVLKKNPERWLKPLRGILDGLQALNSPQKGLRLALYSAGIWGSVIVYYVVLLNAFPQLTQDLTAPYFLIAAVVTWATALGMTTPTQAGIGGYHVAARLALTLPFGAPLSLAATYGWLAWAISYVLGVVLGAVALISMGVSLKEIRQPQKTS